MNRLKAFDRALFGRQIGAISIIVILDVICLLICPFFGQMSFISFSNVLIIINMLNTCILYHSYIVSMGDTSLELITEKIIYYPITRGRFLWNKYIKTLIFVVIQLLLTAACLGLGYMTSNWEMEPSRWVGGFLMVYTSILLTSGMAVIVMHIKSLGLYLSLLLYYPLTLIAKAMEHIHSQLNLNQMDEVGLAALVAVGIFIIWILMLWLAVKIYEKIT
jgi:hypothetical protein